MIVRSALEIAFVQRRVHGIARAVAPPVADHDVEVRRGFDELRDPVGRMLAVGVDDDQGVRRLRPGE